MHIFLVNDDGIGAVGIMALLEASVKRGHRVTMCAPSGQMSAASQRITLNQPLMVREYPLKQENAVAYAIDGTPADCVRVGLCPGGLVKDKPDLLISGINNGHNAGTAVYYSGTVAAAREGSLMRVPAVAASIAYRAAEELVYDMADFVVRMGEKHAAAPFARGEVLNINAPALPVRDWAGVHYAPLSQAHFTDRYEQRFHPRSGGSYFWLDMADDTEPPEEGSDLWHLSRNAATLTLMGNIASAPEESFLTGKYLD